MVTGTTCGAAPFGTKNLSQNSVPEPLIALAPPDAVITIPTPCPAVRPVTEHPETLLP